MEMEFVSLGVYGEVALGSPLNAPRTNGKDVGEIRLLDANKIQSREDAKLIESIGQNVRDTCLQTDYYQIKLYDKVIELVGSSLYKMRKKAKEENNISFKVRFPIYRDHR